MPFKSKAQRRKFYYLKSQGKMTQKTIDKWENETPAKIPERSMNKKAFLSGFYKRAAEVYVAPAPEVGAAHDAKALLWNEAGGVDPRTPEDMDVAASVGLMTLPQAETGASCSNCVHFRLLDGGLGSGFCTNPQVKQDVTVRMLCALWENEGALRPYEDAGAMLPNGQMMAGQPALSDEIMADMQGGAEPPMEEGTAPLEGEEQAALPPMSGGASDDTGEPRRETSSGPQKHTININLGREKKAFAAGFNKAAAENGASGAKATSPYEVYFFTTSWSQPAKAYKKVFDQVASLYPEANVKVVDVEKERTHPLVTRLNIKSVPYIVAMRRGITKPVDGYFGDVGRERTKEFFDGLYRGVKKEAANIHMILRRLGRLKKGTSVDAYLKRKRR